LLGKLLICFTFGKIVRNGEESWPTGLPRVISKITVIVVVALIKRKTTDFVCGLKIYSLS
jgi:hypothetical protein